MSTDRRLQDSVVPEREHTYGWQHCLITDCRELAAGATYLTLIKICVADAVL